MNHSGPCRPTTLPTTQPLPQPLPLLPLLPPTFWAQQRPKHEAAAPVIESLRSLEGAAQQEVLRKLLGHCGSAPWRVVEARLQKSVKAGGGGGCCGGGGGLDRRSARRLVVCVWSSFVCLSPSFFSGFQVAWICWMEVDGRLTQNREIAFV